MAAEGTGNPFMAYALGNKPRPATPPAAAPARRRLSPAANAACSPVPAAPVKGSPTSGTTAAAKAVGVPEKLGSQPLRLILLGHNPSEHAWRTGHYYSNPSNRLWPILIKTGIAPAEVKGPAEDDLMPAAAGVGFTDVGSGVPGTDSSKFKTTDFQHWQQSFYRRLAAHVKQACDSIGCVCGTCGAPALVAFTGKRQYQELLKLDAQGNLLTKQRLRNQRHQQQQQTAQQGQPAQHNVGPSSRGATSRKRKAVIEPEGGGEQDDDAVRTPPPNQQQQPLPGGSPATGPGDTSTASAQQPATATVSQRGSQTTTPPPPPPPAAAAAPAAATGVPYGPQSHLPAGWPLPPSTEVWVCTSTSGACPLTNAQREEPYQRLAARLRDIQWPRADLPRCSSRAAAQHAVQV